MNTGESLYGAGYSNPAATGKDEETAGVAVRPLRVESVQEIAPLLSAQKDSYLHWFGEEVAAGVDGVWTTCQAPGTAAFVAGTESKPKGYAIVVNPDGSESPMLAALWVIDGCHEVAEALVARATDSVTSGSASGSAQLLEAQDLGYGMGRLSRALLQHSSRSSRRLYLEASLASQDRSSRASSGPPGVNVTVRPYRDGDLLAVARLCHRAFEASIDAEFQSSYRTLTGCLDRTAGTTRGRAWGGLLPEASVVASDADGRIVGYALVTRMGQERAHLVETAVCPRVVGKGIGAKLLAEAKAGSAAAGVRLLSLCVTDANERAMRLYRRSGFTTVRAFRAYLLGGQVNPRPVS